MMKGRERIRAVMEFRKPDVLPWCEMDFDIETLLRWLEEGLPAHKIVQIGWEAGSAGGVSLLNWPVIKEFDPYSYFGCYKFGGLSVPLDLGPIPRFKQKVISKTERYIDTLTETGAVARRLRQTDRGEQAWYNMPLFLSFPVTDRETWKRYKERLNPSTPVRYPKDWDREAYVEAFEDYRESVTRLTISGFYGFGAQLMGIPSFISMFYKDPELIEDIAEHWEYFTLEAVKNAVEGLKNRIDLVYWWEDMAETNGPCISPRLYKQFLLPHYKKVTQFFRKHKINHILMDSDGNLNAIIDLIIEAGITGLWPLEANTGMNAIDIKQKYGDKLFLMGNLNKTRIAKGGEEMRREVDSKLSPLKEKGGYIPSIDHVVHVEFELEKFREYANYLKSQLEY